MTGSPGLMLMSEDRRWRASWDNEYGHWNVDGMGKEDGRVRYNSKESRCGPNNI
jgi:hypothetical protein